MTKALLTVTAYVVWVAALLFLRAAQPHLLAPKRGCDCTRAVCPSANGCPHGAVPDPCGCCLVCAIASGEPCDPSIGLCAKGLSCRITSESSGVCAPDDRSSGGVARKLTTCQANCGLYGYCYVLGDDSEHCVCPGNCNVLQVSPVCGSDGLTYANDCFLAEAACTAKLNITTVHPGPCSTCDFVSCGQYEVCVMDSDTIPRCVCPREDCTKRPQDPLCGTDGRTYSNTCRMRQFSCLNKVQVKVRHKGACDPCAMHPCPPYGTCVVLGGVPSCRCPETCPGIVSPVCSTQGLTHTSECELKRFACKRNISVSVKMRGPCDPCEGVVCPSYGMCTTDANRQPTCGCVFDCSEQQSGPLVCGSNGQFYPSLCALKQFSCLHETSIEPVAVTTCDPCMSNPCKFNSTCRVNAIGKLTCTCEFNCSEEMNFVCGSNGQTYTSMCSLWREACVLQENIVPVFNFMCLSDSDSFPHPSSANPLSIGIVPNGIDRNTELDGTQDGSSIVSALSGGEIPQYGSRLGAAVGDGLGGSSVNRSEADCSVGGREFSEGQNWVQDNCSQECWCFSGMWSCNALCSTVPGVSCPPGEELISFEVPHSQFPECSCSQHVCTPSWLPDRTSPTETEGLQVTGFPVALNQTQALDEIQVSCEHGALSFRVGETYPLDNCSQLCNCSARGFRCSPLCTPVPLDSIICGQNEYAVIERVPSPAHGECSCDVARCKPSGCPHEGGIIPMGDSRILNCSIVTCGPYSSLHVESLPCPQLDCTKQRRVQGECCAQCDYEVGVEVWCERDRMVIILSRSYVRSRNLVLEDPQCVATSNTTHTMLETRMDTCGTKMEWGRKSIIFRNVVRTRPTTLQSKHIIRSSVNIPFSCMYETSVRRVLGGFRTSTQTVSLDHSSYGHFGISIVLEDRYGKEAGSDRPIELEPGEEVVVRVTSQFPRRDLSMVLDRCHVTPSPRADDTVSHLLFEDGCPEDESITILERSWNLTRFTFEAFSFKGYPRAVFFVHCSASVCANADPNALCFRTCPTGRSRRSLGQRHQHDVWLATVSVPYVL